MTRLLLVEDEPQLRRALSISLRNQGYEIEAAESGEEALQRVGADALDGVVLDLSAPGVHGVDLVRRLRESTAVPIVLLSAREEEADKVAALDAGADDYVTKPFGMGSSLPVCGGSWRCGRRRMWPCRGGSRRRASCSTCRTGGRTREERRRS